MLRSVVALACVACALAVALAAPDSAWACRDYDGHRNSVVPPTSCGSEDVGAGLRWRYWLRWLRGRGHRRGGPAAHLPHHRGA